jgi:hypothetical protein
MFGEQQCDADTSALPGMGNFTGANLGVVHPKTRCDCVDGKCKCFAWTVCAAPVMKPPVTVTLTKPPLHLDPPPPPATTIDSCPDSEGEPPIGAVCSKDLKCDFGKLVCCEATYSEMTCECKQGQVMNMCWSKNACRPELCNTKPPV